MMHDVLVVDAIPRVLLDACVVVEAGYGRSTAFRHLLRNVADQRVELIVPEMAVAETVYVYRRRLSDARKVLEQLPNLMAAAGYPRDQPSPRALERRMEDELRGLLSRAGVTPAPAPAVDSDALVARVLARRKPTKQLARDDKGHEVKEQNEGFRDQLLWEHVRAAAEGGPVIFVCGNTHDFADRQTIKDGRAELHPELLEDLESDKRDGRSTGDVTLVLDVKTLVSDFLQDENESADMERLLAGSAGEQLRAAVRDLVNEAGVAVEEFEPPIALEGHVEEATLIAADRTDNIYLVDAFLESSDDEPREYAVTAEVKCSGPVQWEVNAPTSWDLETFSGLVEGDIAGGGFIHDVDGSDVLVTVNGRFSPSDDEWEYVELDVAQETPDEAQQRREQNMNAQMRREQELGLIPSDDEIDDRESEQ
jgi:PIN domain